MDFLSENNPCGTTLLRLCSRGNAIIAELLRLSDHVPPVFFGRDANQARYEPVLADFKYFAQSDLFEERVEKNELLADIDAELRESNFELLGRFYSLFESIYKYVTDLRAHFEAIDDAVFIQQTFESVLNNPDGKQLMCESVYLYGVMLILLDNRIPGGVRERLLVSYLRYKGQSELPLIDEIVKLCGRTGFVAARRDGDKTLPPHIPDAYPEKYFARVSLPQHVLKMIVARLRSDDVYNQIPCYPMPEHRSTALATQACMLYVILYFTPQVLHNEAATMREIVDKHFADNWVIAIYLGFTVDLAAAWERYRAARAALANTATPDNVRHLTTLHTRMVPKCAAQLAQLLRDGVLSDEYLLDNTAKLMAVMRDCNVSLRWLLLHSITQPKAIADIVRPAIDAKALLNLLLLTAQYEFKFRSILSALLEHKQERWDKYRTDASERMKELSEYFSGERALTRVKKNENLMQWFATIADKVLNLDYSDSTAAGRKMHQLIQALDGVGQFQEIEESETVKFFLKETRQTLTQMVRVINIQEEHLVVLSLVSDVSYAWEILRQRTYIGLVQERIRADPSSVLMIRSTFEKMRSILDLPLIRINQASSPDLFSVSEYYSNELVYTYVARVLEIIPRSMFRLLKDIIDLETHKIPELPTKVEKNELKNYVCTDERFALARLTYEISVFTEGILAMETTLVGTIKVDPKKLLEEGIRKQLVEIVANEMNAVLQFSTRSINELEQRLQHLHATLDGYRRSMQYIQDYVRMYGLKVWQEEFSRLVNFYVEQECNLFVKKQVYGFESRYQSAAIRIPEPAPDPRYPGTKNFVGRLVRELLVHTSPYSTLFLDQMSGWYAADGRELVGIRTFTRLLKTFSVYGVCGIDRLLSFMLVKQLQTTVTILRREITGKRAVGAAAAKEGGGEPTELGVALAALQRAVTPTTILPGGGARVYAETLSRMFKDKRTAEIVGGVLLHSVAQVGQIVLIRRHVANLVSFSSKMDSSSLANSIDVLNRSVLNDIQKHYLHPDRHPYPPDENTLLADLTAYLEQVGLHDPVNKIYITSDPIEMMPLLVFLVVVAQLPHYTYSSHLSTVTVDARLLPKPPTAEQKKKEATERKKLEEKKRAEEAKARADEARLKKKGDEKGAAAAAAAAAQAAAAATALREDPLPRGPRFADFSALAVGCIALLRQFHTQHTQKFLAYLGQYVRTLYTTFEDPSASAASADGKSSSSSSSKEAKQVEQQRAAARRDMTNALHFLETFCRYSHVDRKTVEGYLPAYIFDHFKH